MTFLSSLPARGGGGGGGGDYTGRSDGASSPATATPRIPRRQTRQRLPAASPQFPRCRPCRLEACDRRQRAQASALGHKPVSQRASLTRLSGPQTEMCSACAPKRKTLSPRGTCTSPHFRNFDDTSVGIVAALCMNRHDTKAVPRITTCCKASNGQPATLGTVDADSGNAGQPVNRARSRRAACRTRVTTTWA